MRILDKWFGYMWVKVKDHPGFPGQSRVKEHHLVWWERTGQRVQKGFVLHHKDHNKTNNAFENLELMTRAAHMKEHNPNQFIDQTVKIKISERAKARCTPEWREAVRERVKRQHAEGKFGIKTWTQESYRKAFGNG